MTANIDIVNVISSFIFFSLYSYANISHYQVTKMYFGDTDIQNKWTMYQGGIPGHLPITLRKPEANAVPCLFDALHWTTIRSESPFGQVLHSLVMVKFPPSITLSGPGSDAEWT